MRCEVQLPFTNSGVYRNSHSFGTLLFDLEKDPNQEHPIVDFEVEKTMIAKMVNLMKSNDAPIDQFYRLGLPIDGITKNKHFKLGVNGKSNIIDEKQEDTLFVGIFFSFANLFKQWALQKK